MSKNMDIRDKPSPKKPARKACSHGACQCKFSFVADLDKWSCLAAEGKRNVRPDHCVPARVIAEAGIDGDSHCQANRSGRATSSTLMKNSNNHVKSWHSLSSIISYFLA
ncbi:hypothetical protein O6H91_02G125900 [Diphasiastrum complanatum]|uniref:Uncharacterized protein n=1 Tax=Diphasiastrum complanatum TaxID=34168 RepID=A0ACC2EKE4_DIPCM|nr:hypothetical protein O6H91_Y194300 [Diphasiastrum complanatum]KAJ7566964.1 hypothetical protein O6H91_02G125900 [Diphasiastrum complanatum]